MSSPPRSPKRSRPPRTAISQPAAHPADHHPRGGAVSTTATEKMAAATEPRPIARAKDLSELHATEDEAIRAAVRRQLDIGLDVISDGEFRRFMFTGSFYDAVSGLAAGTGQVPFTNEEGEVEFYTGLP